MDGKCENLIDLCNEELSLPESKYLTEALLLRGTAHLYMGAFADAITDFDSLIDQPNVDKTVSQILCCLFFFKKHRTLFLVLRFIKKKLKKNNLIYRSVV